MPSIPMPHFVKLVARFCSRKKGKRTRKPTANPPDQSESNPKTLRHRKSLPLSVSRTVIHSLRSLSILFHTPFPNSEQSSAGLKTPLASLKRGLLSKRDASSVFRSSGSLGPDPSSKHFASRVKSVAFLRFLGDGEWKQLDQSYFIQATDYNDKSGGYRRHYTQLPDSFLAAPETRKLLRAFMRAHDIPVGGVTLVQVQTSLVARRDEGRCLTGQGIHSDGANAAMLACLRRENVKGARNSVYRDGDGEKPILDSKTLHEGDVLFWRDNRVYHYVEPARLVNDNRTGSRTVLIAHYPAVHYITGETNPENTLPPSGKHPKNARVHK